MKTKQLFDIGHQLLDFGERAAERSDKGLCVACGVEPVGKEALMCSACAEKAEVGAIHLLFRLAKKRLG